VAWEIPAAWAENCGVVLMGIRKGEWDFK